jgi:hypothetical protein
MEVDGQLQAAAALPPGRASDHFIGGWLGSRACPGVLSLSGFEIRVFERLAAAWSLYRVSSFGCIMYQQPRNVSVLHRINNEKSCQRSTAIGSNGAV